MRILLNGYTGRMGQMVIQTVESHPEDKITAFVAVDNENDGEGYFSNFGECDREADVAIDFSHHSGIESLLSYCLFKGMPAVICTTGFTEAEKEVIEEASYEIPVFLSANMSVGIAAMKDLVTRAVKMFPDADIEIVEKHHNRKLDVPSGTALVLADAVREVRKDAVYQIGRHENGKRNVREIGIHSLRMGNEVGTHEVYINTGSECLVLSHEAESRAVFADGALKAARFLIGKPAGLYDMKDLLGEESA